MAYVENELYVPVREVVSPDSPQQRKSRQIVLNVLWGITYDTNMPDPISRLPENKPFLALARSISELIADERLIVKGRDQVGLFQTGIMDTGCYDRGALFVGPLVDVEIAKRLGSLRAEMVYKMASAVLVDGNIPEVGGLKSMDEVRQVVVGYLRTLPPDTAITADQSVMLNTR